MTQADNYRILIDGARNQSEWVRAMDAARNKAISETTDSDGNVCILEFADGSVLDFNK